MGLPDEYAEPLTIPVPLGATPPAVGVEPRVIRFGQAHEGYPFYADLAGMMRSNKLPRLRYVWHHIAAFVNNGAAKSALPEGPYSSQAPAFARGTSHRIPDGNATQPWGLLAQRPGPAGRSNVVLYRTGDDEATVEAVFPRPASVAATPGAWLQGILVVTPKIWFNFLPSAAGDFASHAKRFLAMQDFHLTLFNKEWKPKQRFLIESVPALRLPRIAILFQPRMEFGPVPQPLSGFVPPNATEANADFVVDVVFQSGPLPLKPPILPAGWPPSTKPRLVLGSEDVNLAVLRFALGAPSFPSTLNKAQIVAADLATLATLVQTMLGDPPASLPRTVRALPA
jgi:hypothetical protein